jgi:hypothetical protein
VSSALQLSCRCRNRLACLALFGLGPVVALALCLAGSAGASRPPSAGVSSTHSRGHIVGVSCASLSACMAVGSDRSSVVVERWNGRRWSVQHVPPGLFGAGAVSCPSGRICFVVGASTAGRWENGKWSTWEIGGGSVYPNSFVYPSSFSSVSCWSAQGCLAVGENPNGNQGGSPAAAIFKHGRWRSLRPRNPGDEEDNLVSVSCSSAASCLAGGLGYVGSDGSSVAIAEIWNGRGWRLTNPPNNPNYNPEFNAVSCRHPHGCVAVGDQWDASYIVDHPWVTTWTQQRWSVLRPNPQPRRLVGALTTVSCPPSGSCVAAGARRRRPLMAMITSRIGTRWTIIQPPGGTPMTSISALSCPVADGCIAIGPRPKSRGGGLVSVRWHGTQHSTRVLPLPAGR